MKPYLFIDVDGVLNPDHKLAGYKTYEIMGYRVHLNPDHGKKLLALSEHYELVWATTWEGLANEYISPKVGLPELPVVEFGTRWPTHRPYPHFVMIKTHKVIEYANGRPFAWMDDDFQKEDYKELRAYPCLPIKIWPFNGIEDKDFEELEAWGKERSDQTS